MKKLLTLLFSFMIVLGLTSPVFAVDIPTTDMANVPFQKNLKLVNDQMTSPAETFAFTVTKVSEDSMYPDLASVPVIAGFSISFTEGEATLAGDANTFNIPLPTYTHVGVYKYRIEETIPAIPTAGVIYDTNDYILTVYVTNKAGGGFNRHATLHNEAVAQTGNGPKVLGAHNEYEAGNLSINKQVGGNTGELDRFFDVVVTLAAPAGTVLKSPVTITGGSHGSNPTVATFVGGFATVNLKIKHGETIILHNLPDGMVYTVTETAPGDGYLPVAYTFSDEGTIKVLDSALETVIINNARTTLVDTGVFLDSLPYILILVVVAGGIAAVVLRRRHSAIQ